MYRRRRRRKPPEKTSFEILLDRFSVSDIQRASRFRDRFIRYHWDYYSSLAYQRTQIADDLRQALMEAAEGPFPFSKWQRIVRYRYTLEPLSTAGSLEDPGRRFNIGNIDPAHFPPFPALYVAIDKHTALQEVFSQDIPPGEQSRVLDFALAKSDSITAVSLSGSLDSVINLKNPSSLIQFVKLIKDFSLPNHLITEAKAMGLPPPGIVRDTTALLEGLLHKDWRIFPMQFDVPAVPQIFGQLVAQAGIEGILYQSKFSGNDCLVIYPQNFRDSDSFVQLDDTPPPGVQIHRLDSTT